MELTIDFFSGKMKATKREKIGHTDVTHGENSTMAASLVKDPRIRSVAWKDLLYMTPWERVRELMIGLPWFAGELFLSGAQIYGAALPCSFMVFLAGIRQSHNAQHYTLGQSRRGTEFAWRFGDTAYVHGR